MWAWDRTLYGLRSSDEGLVEEDSDDEDSDADGGAKRSRVTAHYIVQRSSGLEEDDGRRKTLAEKTWARQAVVAHGVSACGAANFEEVPGREHSTARSQRRKRDYC